MQVTVPVTVIVLVPVYVEVIVLVPDVYVEVPTMPKVSYGRNSNLEFLFQKLTRAGSCGVGHSLGDGSLCRRRGRSSCSAN